jgi:hypothetical protein
MVYHMKTTVELRDALLIAAKKQAAEDRTTLKEILERGLQRELSARRHMAAQRGGRPIRWVTAKGGLPEGLEVADRARMHDWLRRNP